jgi:hypothetical protein
LLVTAGLKVNVFAVLRLPLHAPLAAQTVAPVEDQVRVAGLPLATLVGLALIETVGTATAWTLENVMPSSSIARMPKHKIDTRLVVMLFFSVSQSAGGSRPEAGSTATLKFRADCGFVNSGERSA